jgi:hypothetical protein
VNLLLVLDWVVLAAVIYGFILFGFVNVKFRWIVQRFEVNPEVCQSPLFFEHRPRYMKALLYVCELISVDFVPDWLLAYAIRKGHIAAHASREAVLKYFTAEEKRQVRRVKWALLLYFGVMFALIAIDSFLPLGAGR